MKSFSFGQLQLRILLLILFLFTSMVLSYRLFVEHPRAEKSLLAFQNKELQLIRLAIGESIKHLQTITYDYAVWNDTYDFASQQNKDYTLNNFVNDTFVSLSIDGVLIVDIHGDIIFSKGFLHNVREHFTLYTDGLSQLPLITEASTRTERLNEPRKSYDVVLTPAGLTLYSVVEIRRSDKSGGFNGNFVFFRQFNQQYIDRIANTVMTPITFELLANRQAISPGSMHWLGELEKTKTSKYSYLYLEDVLGRATAQLRVEHQQYQLRPLVDAKTVSFILLFSFVIFLVYLLFNNRIVQPVQLFLHQLKSLNNTNEEISLAENFPITELNDVSKHINHLRRLISEQHELLSQQLSIDSLTGLSNRRGFDEHLAKQCDLMTRQGVPFSIVLIEIDYFEQYRSVVGLVDGDHLLIQLSEILRSHIKRKNDMCAHFKKEEFVILYSGIDQIQLEQILKSIITHVNKLKIPHPNSDVSGYVTLSTGACYIDRSQGAYDYISTKNVLRAADFALYQSRDKGRNCQTVLSFETFSEIVKVTHK